MPRRGKDRFEDLLSLERLDELLTNDRVPRQTIFVLDARRSVGSEFETLPSDSVIGRDLASKGASLYFHFIDQFCPPLRTFCDELEQCLGRPVSAFAFLNPPHAQARKLHWDPLDVIILQVEGEKIWDLHEPLVELPLAEHDSDKYRFDTKRTMRVTLKAGDTLYVPRGWIHRAESTDDISLSITIGVRPLTWRHVIGESKKRVLQHARRRSTLASPTAGRAALDELTTAHLALVREQATPGLIRERALSEPRQGGSDLFLTAGYLSSFFLDDGALRKLTFQRSPAPFLVEARGRRWMLAAQGYKTILSAPEMGWVRAVLARRGRFRLPAGAGAVDVRSLVQRLTAMRLIELADERAR